MRFFRNNFGFLLILILSFWAVNPLFIPGFFPMHDDTQVARVYEMGKMLKEGMFPVRWVPDLGYGYGYPIFNFYAPFSYYIGGLFTVIGFDALFATKLMMILGIVMASVFMYLLARKFFGEWGGVVSGIFYLYSSYHAVEIYVRGDVAEFWAYAFIPLMVLGFYKKSIVVGSIGFAGIILSHNLTALMVAPLVLSLIAMGSLFAPHGKKLSIFYRLSFIAFVALLISAFYWIPALLEMKHTNVLSQIGGGADFRDHFVCLNQFWESSWGFGGSIPGCVDGLSFKIGKLHILGSILAVFLVIFHPKLKKYKKLLILPFIGLSFAMFLSIETSKMIWEAIPAMSFFQYPWRFLILISFFSSFIVGALVILLKEIKIKPFLTAIVLVVFILYFNLKLFTPQTIYPTAASDYTNERALKWEVSKISDEFLPKDFKKPKSESEIAKNPILFRETNIEKVSNLVSITGILALVIGIIFFRPKKLKDE